MKTLKLFRLRSKTMKKDVLDLILEIAPDVLDPTEPLSSEWLRVPLIHLPDRLVERVQPPQIVGGQHDYHPENP